MLFNSFHFLIFFPIVLTLYYMVNQKVRWILLLIASYYFYMSWNPTYIILIMFSTVVDYFTALTIEKQVEKKKKLGYLILSLVVNLGVLFLFKYYNFFALFSNQILGAFSLSKIFPKSHLLLPVGISFYTFQTLSYTIDVYRGKLKAEKHFGIFAVYVSFFPQLVAGPIERATHLLPQFKMKFNPNWDNIRSGLLLIVWGLFKKVVIADRVGVFVDQVYNTPEQYDGISSLLATYLFAFQIFCDFSGYSDMAIGTARLLGFDLMKNFNRPYFAKTIQEFWTRWHISLSTWFRDYLYIPLGGNRVSIPRNYLNIMIIFVVSGIWHGAYYNFIVWGFLHGCYIIFWKITESPRIWLIKLIRLNKYPKLLKGINIFITFQLASFAWIFFRAKYFVHAKTIIFNILSIDLSTFLDFIKALILNFGAVKVFSDSGLDQYDLQIGLIAILFMEIIHIIQENNYISYESFKRKSNLYRWSVYLSLTIICLLFGKFLGNQQFIYFQF